MTKSVTIRSDTIHVNPNQLLHRMICTVRTEEQLAEIFGYELCTYPPSLFDLNELMRKGTKSSIQKVLPCGETDSPPCNALTLGKSYVVDGVHLLHRVVWQHPATFKRICQQYVEYVLFHYGKAIVVFDGYREEFNTKDEEHLRRSVQVLT